MLLAEYVLTPEVFFFESYESNEICELSLRIIRDQLIHQSVVRDLRCKDWSKEVSKKENCLHPKGKELLKKLKQYNRLRSFPPMASVIPGSEQDWCNEALLGHNNLPLNGIIITRNIVDKFNTNRSISEVGRVNSKDWWKKHSDGGIRIPKCIDEYQKELSIIFRYANSIMFIDPYLDPRDIKYRSFFELIVDLASTRIEVPLIEFHRKWDVQVDNWESIFTEELSQMFSNAEIKAKGFIWNNFHDRHVISDLLGISVTSGFDTTSDAKNFVDWNRVSNDQRDKVQREFDKASSHRILQYQFDI